MSITSKVKCFDTLTNRYPGGPLLNPLGLAKDITKSRDWKLKEIKNGLFYSFFLIYCPFFNWGFQSLLSFIGYCLYCRTTCNGSHARHFCASFCDSCRTN